MSNESPAAGTAMRWLSWAQVDVFADEPYQGNMLAVFPDATGLTQAQMQAIARETKLSETTFVFPRETATEQREGVRVRIFTTEEELPFAGHPTLGTASLLRLQQPRFADADQITLDLDVGPVRVLFLPHDAATPQHGLVAEMLQPDPVFLGDLEPAACDALGLAALQLHPWLRPQVVSTGLPILIVPLASYEALATLQPDLSRDKALRSSTPAKFAYFLAQHDEHTWRARLPLYGAEDPATGSAAGCAISYLVAQGAVTPDEPVTILQGEFIHRPSRILALASRSEGSVRNVRVRGCTIPVATGRFLHP